MRLIVIALSCLPLLSGCFFLYIPGGLFASGNTCVTETASAGQRITDAYRQRSGVVKELHGRSDRCQSGNHPILATVEYD